jgi:hypothetical protein
MPEREAKERPAKPPARKVKEAAPKSGGVPLWVWLAVGGGGAALVLLVACAGVIGWVVLHLHGASPTGPALGDGPSPFGGSGPDTSAVVTAVNFNRLDVGMKIEQVKAILGEGRKLGPKELPPPEARGGGDAQGARSWYQWGQGDGFIGVGLSKARSGVERVTVMHLKLPKEAAVRCRSGSVADEADLRDAPQAPVGKLSELIVGKWAKKGQLLYEFVAPQTFREFSNGTMRADGFYQVPDDSTVTMSVAGGRVGGQWSVVLYSPDEMRLYEPAVESPNCKPLLKRMK